MGNLKKNLSEKEVEAELNRQLAILEFGAVEITPIEDFKKMLRHSIENAKPLRVKYGIDPTGFDVHIGHLVPLRKMRVFQEMGHTGVVIIGDYTAQIGDPTGKTESRPPLTLAQARANAERYMEQIFTVIEQKQTEVRYQSEWFGDKNLIDVMGWAGQTTVAKLLAHDTFKNRLEENQSLSLHELFYPVLQGIDSVFISADVELGGSDQKFNVLMGRDYQKNKNLRQQVALLTPILTGLCGTQKMSKSLGNYIGVLDEPFDKFGKVMSIPDKLMLDYAKYAANMNKDEYEKFAKDLESNSIHPNIAKKLIAERVVALFHGAEKGHEMREQFERVFAKGKIPDEVEEFKFERGMGLVALLVACGALPSNSEARRMIKQNAVSVVDGDKLTDEKFLFTEDLKGKVLKIGKRKFIKLV
ncbi:MAG: tyrosine--tRNA ligase [Bacteriovoracaceae bacterium]|nr:tyrosine--tRNA ligase [Bacteriovoracaceae bacterium]